MMIRMCELRVKPGGFQMLGWRCKPWMDGVEDPPTSLRLSLKGRLVLLTSATIPRLRHYRILGINTDVALCVCRLRRAIVDPNVLKRLSKSLMCAGNRPRARASANDKTSANLEEFVVEAKMTACDRGPS
jgi:hypothetical protein